MRKVKLSKVSAIHYFKLIFRSMLLIAATVDYIFARLHNFPQRFPWALTVIWAVFAIEMVLRFFPSRLESKGCQKQFKKNFAKTDCDQIQEEHGWWRTAIALGSWLALNGVIAVFYYAGYLDRGILILISLFYSVCDMICILFFCPFQSWMLKNKCCGSCRVYNWDYAMMFTPYALIGGFFGWSLLGLSLCLLLRWEITYRIHPKRFYPSTNEFLSCANCNEKLCAHKKQLKALWQQETKRLKEKRRKHIKKLLR